MHFNALRVGRHLFIVNRKAYKKQQFGLSMTAKYNLMIRLEVSKETDQINIAETEFSVSRGLWETQISFISQTPVTKMVHIFLSDTKERLERLPLKEQMDTRLLQTGLSSMNWEGAICLLVKMTRNI